MSRKLATIQTIKSLDRIEGKDRILYASFENVGFRVIVSSDLKLGDKVVYCEVDSLLPVQPEFEFLRSRCYNEKWNGFRIKNMKMAGLYSEGLVLPLSINNRLADFPDGTDVTKLLGIIKYDPEALEENASVTPKKVNRFKAFLYRRKYLMKVYNFLFPKEKKVWPKWAHKSDETRAQNLPYIFEAYKGKQFFATEKLDGKSSLYAIRKDRFFGYKFYVCSRNLQCVDYKKGGSKTDQWFFAHERDVKKRLKAMRKELKADFYIQGELCGPKIQGNKYGFKKLRLFVFNMRMINTGEYLAYDKMKSICEKHNFEVVPILSMFTWNFTNMKELLKFADGVSLFGDNVLREGVVIRSVSVENPDKDQSNMKSFKVISPSFDLKWNK